MTCIDYPARIRTLAISKQKIADSDLRAAKSGAFDASTAMLADEPTSDGQPADEPSSPIDSDLQRLLDAWPSLSPEDRQALADHAAALAAGRPSSHVQPAE
jgi:hypothetical protein